MSFNAAEQPSSGGITIEPMDTGTYPARIAGVSIVGKHSSVYNGEVKEPKINLALTYEFLDEFLKDENGDEILDKPRFLTENMPFYNLSNTKAKSTERYLAVDPLSVYGGDWSKLITFPIMVSVVQNAGKGKNLGKIFNNVDSIAPMRPKEVSKASPLVNPFFLFDFYNPTKEEWEKLPGIVKSICRRAVDFQGTEMEKWDQEGNENNDKPTAPTTSVKPPKDEEENW